MALPVLLAVDDDAEARNAVEAELRERYSRDYRIICTPSPEAALSTLERLAQDGEEVALVLAGRAARDDRQRAARRRSRRLHPHAKRGAADRRGAAGATGRPARRSSTRSRTGQIDHYVLRPSAPPDELFHQTISELPARVGRRAARRSAHDPRRRRVVVRAGPTSCARCSAAARSRTRSAWPTPTRAARCSPARATATRAPARRLPERARSWRTRATPRSRERRGRAGRPRADATSTS